MSIWNLADGSNAADTGNTFDAGGGNFEPIPDNTDVLAAIEEVSWESHENVSDGMRFIDITWTVLSPSDYANRKVFQKVRVNDPDIKKADKARRMFAAIDANAGGHLAAAGTEPSNTDLLMKLANKPMVLKLKIWEIDDKQGNWVCAVSPKKTVAPVADAASGQSGDMPKF